MHQDQLAARLSSRTLGVNQHPDLRLGLINNGFNRPAMRNLRPPPEVPRDGCKVRISEQRVERRQALILTPGLISEGLEHRPAFAGKEKIHKFLGGIQVLCARQDSERLQDRFMQTFVHANDVSGLLQHQ